MELTLNRENPVDLGEREPAQEWCQERGYNKQRERETARRGEGENVAWTLWVQVNQSSSLWLPLLFEPVPFSLRGSGLSFCYLQAKVSWPIFMETPMLARTWLYTSRGYGSNPVNLVPGPFFKDVVFQHCILCNVSRLKNTNKKEEDWGQGLARFFLVVCFECFCLFVFLKSSSCSVVSACDPLDCSPRGSSVHGIFQARIPEWVLPFPSPGDLPDPVTELSSPVSPAGGFFISWAMCQALY